MRQSEAPQISCAMVLAAGLGRRMRAAPDDPPKPLTRIAGETLLDRMLARLEAVGVSRIVVNVHHKADMIEAHLATRAAGAEIIISDERRQRLETGGGVVKALPHLGAKPFFVCNADILWREERPNLQALLARHNALRTDGFASNTLLLAPRADCLGYDGAGDFDILANGQLARRAGVAANYVYAGVQILPPDLLVGAPDGAFSLNQIFDAAIRAGRLHGQVLDGQWMHVGTPEGRDAAEAALAGKG